MSKSEKRALFVYILFTVANLVVCTVTIVGARSIAASTEEVKIDIAEAKRRL